jgi:hypothetical protein
MLVIGIGGRPSCNSWRRLRQSIHAFGPSGASFGSGFPIADFSSDFVGFSELYPSDRRDFDNIDANGGILNVPDAK